VARVQGLASSSSELGMVGDYAATFQSSLDDLPGELSKSERAYRGCGNALAKYSTGLEHAQSVAGSLDRIVDSAGRELIFAHDDAGRLTGFTAPHPEVAGDRFTAGQYRYDRAGNLVSMTDALGQERRYAYDGHLLVRETDRAGLSFSFEYDGGDERARCLHTWGDGGIYDRRLTYQPDVTVVVDSLGHASTHEHEDGLVVRTTDQLGAVRSTEFEFLQPVAEVDELGRITSYEYDVRGNLIGTTTPDGAAAQAVYDGRDLPVSAVDRAGGAGPGATTTRGCCARSATAWAGSPSTGTARACSPP